MNFIYNATGHLAEIQQGYTKVQLQQSMVFLWTVGSFIHSSFDMLIWHLTACACLRPGGICESKGNKFCQNFGVYIAVLLVTGCIFTATTVVVIRLNEENDDGYDYSGLIETQPTTAADAFAAQTSYNETEVVTDDDIEMKPSEKFSFLIGYSLELVFALCVFYFLTSTVFFSGILGCGRVPILGGRPYELKEEVRKSIRQTNSSGSRSSGNQSETSEC